MPDQKISELPLSAVIQSTDISVLVHVGQDQQFTFAQLVAYIQTEISRGSRVVFVNSIPANSFGLDGDIAIVRTTNKIYQRLFGTWSDQYTFPSANGNTVIYGAGTPNNATGLDGDTYVDTDAGVFYKKTAGSWSPVFSMATGPAGPPGTAGINGVNGADGKTILNGTTPPSNSDGTNGDFWLNTSTYYLYGPKASGVWPSGVSLIPSGAAYKALLPYSISDSRFSYDALTYTLTFTLDAALKAAFPYQQGVILQAVLGQGAGLNRMKYLNNYDIVVENDGTDWIKVEIQGFTPGSYSLILY